MKRVSFLSNWRRRILFYLLVMVIFTVALEIIRIRNNSLHKLAAERNRHQLQNVLPFERLELPQHLSLDVRFLQNIDDTRDFVKFRENYFAATSGGLVKFNNDGKIIKHFTVLDGLPESDLTKLSVFKDRLFIGTKSKNLIEFDGEKFARFKWINLDLQAVTAFFTDDTLLIGTFNGGLIEFDGQDFREIKAENKRISRINCLYKKDSRLFVGTFDNGLWISDAGNWKHFTNADGLTSNRIIGIIQKGENIFVAADLGLAVISLSDKTFKTIATLPMISGFIEHNQKLFLTRNDGEIYEGFQNKKEQFGITKSSSAKQENLSGASFAVADDKLFLIGNKGIWNADDFKSFSETNENSLTDNFVSSIATGADGKLWAGTFRNGIDIFSADGRKTRHLKTENIREINSLLYDAEKKQMLAATSNGAFSFPENSQINNLLTTNERLPSNSIMHVSSSENSIALATSKGLLTNETGKIRVYSTFNGLPNNNIYATAFNGKSLFVGTLGGLAEIEGGKIVRVFKDSNSNLKQNWITALASTKNRLFIGTYGGGIFELTASGEIRSFADEAGKFVVNPNALFSDGKRLYAGTLDGVRVLDLETQNWTVLRKDLPSEAVFAIAGNSQNIFFGTTNGIAQIDKKYFESRLTE